MYDLFPPPIALTRSELDARIRYVGRQLQRAEERRAFARGRIVRAALERLEWVVDGVRSRLFCAVTIAAQEPGEGREAHVLDLVGGEAEAGEHGAEGLTDVGRSWSHTTSIVGVN